MDMVTELKEGDREKVAALLKNLPDYLNALSIIEGNTAGRVFVDDAIAPKTVVVWECKNGIFLAGNGDNDHFNMAFAEFLEKTLIPRMNEKGQFMNYLMHTSSWDGKVECILNGRQLNYDSRRLYSLENRDMNCEKTTLSQDYELAWVDKNIVNSHMANADKVKEELDTVWKERTLFFEKAGGYCAIKDDCIAGWCLFELSLIHI